MRRMLFWIIGCTLTVFTTCAFASFALSHGETIHAPWLVAAACMIFFIGYRYYSRFLANSVLLLDAKAPTPAVRHNDGLDYVPTNRFVLFGHHFAAIAGAGPLVGPVLAAQMGYAPGMLWILVGVVLAGAVQDFFILVISMRRDGRSLGTLIRTELGWLPGVVAQCATFMIMVIILAVLALIVVKALTNSPWSLFTVGATVPIGLFMGIYLRYLRPGRVTEVSIVGFVLLFLAIMLGRQVSESALWAPCFTASAEELVWLLTGYGFVAAVLPVWLLLAPRDYLSTFLKIGTMLALALAILLVAPTLKMPAWTPFINGSGPVWAGGLFPFLFITIACGAISGFHSLIASGTTPKMIANETDARFIGYGGMLMESFVAIMALITACCLEPGVYFAINSPPALIGTTAQQAAETISQWGFTLTPDMLTTTAETIGEQTILSRTGGAPTLAIGIAQIFSQLFENKAMLAFWYHFAILFEALFILTAVDAGTRAGRFMLQDLLGTFFPNMRHTESWPANVLATGICVGMWGYFLYQGVIDPLGGINSLWPLFGIANQMLASIALILATVVLVKRKQECFIAVTLAPTVWLLSCTLTASWQKAFSINPKLGFLAHANQYQQAIEKEIVLAPAKNLTQMRQILFNDYVDATLTIGFAVVVLFLFFWGLRHIYLMLKNRLPRENHFEETGLMKCESQPTRCC
ncbi:TPA: carbon starvation CstA family protein [Legionella feeleii]|uniref:Carbon starvation protein A n=1 Tax=Legionella feeleii TaxID=453 RepID=A0A378IWC5_9GAMM|nr:carbon starvation CstA family protein [Legionella feeleii]STX39353.1 Carbon starvation protein A [Legionella feeleii]